MEDTKDTKETEDTKKTKAMSDTKVEEKKDASCKNFTIVTALVDVGRGKWDGMYYRPFSWYLNYFEKILLRFDCNMMIFVEEENIPFVEEKRKNFPGKTKIIPISLEKDYLLIEDLERIEECQLLMSKEVNTKDLNCPELAIPIYPIVVNNKVEFMHRAMIMDHFGTDYFIWIDAGYGHGKYEVPEKHQWDPSGLIQEAGEKVLVCTLQQRISSEEYKQFYQDHQDFIDGGLWIAKKEALEKLHSIYYETIRQTMTDLSIIDDDQYYMAMCCAHHPELFFELFVGGWHAREWLVQL
jgi:protein YibB